MIGAKVLATGLLLAAALAAAVGMGGFAPDRLAARGFGDLFLLGAFAVVVGTILYWLWGLGERSHSYFRWASDATWWEGAERHFLGGGRRRITIGENRGDAFDLPPRVQHLACVAAALLVGLACLDARAVKLLGEAVRGVARAGSYCPEAAPAPVEVIDPNAPGCALIRRAFALGYTDSLGDCAPKKAAASEAAPICTLRQRDEPLLHYAWRLLGRFWQDVRPRTGAGSLTAARRELAARLDHLPALAATTRQVLESAPHASHHVWTNLADPGGAFRPATCGDRYRWLAHRPEEGSAARVFEHVLAQLLFEARYEPAAASCREVHVHFGAAPDTCARLAASPEAVLAESGADGPVRQALERHRLAGELAALGQRPPAAAPGSFLSFQCYVEEPGAPSQRRYDFTLSGHVLSAREVRLPPAPPGTALHTDRYDAIARLLVPGFHYGALLSEAGLEQASSSGVGASFGARDFLLSRLYGLASVDIYLDPGFISARPDLLEVYPYQRHLKNYVQLFRRQFTLERGRL